MEHCERCACDPWRQAMYRLDLWKAAAGALTAADLRGGVGPVDVLHLADFLEGSIVVQNVSADEDDDEEEPAEDEEGET